MKVTSPIHLASQLFGNQIVERSGAFNISCGRRRGALPAPTPLSARMVAEPLYASSVRSPGTAALTGSSQRTRRLRHASCARIAGYAIGGTRTTTCSRPATARATRPGVQHLGDCREPELALRSAKNSDTGKLVRLRACCPSCRVVRLSWAVTGAIHSGLRAR
jgi:hypothetical protein